MFNFYVVLAGHDMVDDAGRAAKCRRNFKAPSLHKQKVQIPKDIPKTWVLTGKNFEEFRRKKNTCSLDQTTQWNTRPLNTTSEEGPCKQ